MKVIDRYGREHYIGGRANLWRADLAGYSLRGVNLKKAKIGRIDLSGADLREADLSFARMWDTDLTGANLEGANLTGAILSEVELGGASMRGAKLVRAKFYSSNLSGANLTGAWFTDAPDLFNVDTSDNDRYCTDDNRVRFIDSDLTGTIFDAGLSAFGNELVADMVPSDKYPRLAIKLVRANPKYRVASDPVITTVTDDPPIALELLVLPSDEVAAQAVLRDIVTKRDALDDNAFAEYVISRRLAQNHKLRAEVSGEALAALDKKHELLVAAYDQVVGLTVDQSIPSEIQISVRREHERAEADLTLDQVPVPPEPNTPDSRQPELEYSGLSR
jgi:hypothetical protein